MILRYYHKMDEEFFEEFLSERISNVFRYEFFNKIYLDTDSRDNYHYSRQNYHYSGLADTTDFGLSTIDQHQYKLYLYHYCNINKILE